MPTRPLPPPVWQLARLAAADATPAERDWIPAIVPGAVQLDWARAHEWPELSFGQNVRHYDGLEDFFWRYRTTIPAVALAPEERLFVCGAGLDFHAEFFLGGERVLTHTGVQTPFEIDVTGVAAGTPLEILFHPAPKRPGVPADRAQASHVTKPAVSYGWDWHPRLISVGLSEEVRFEVRPALHVRHVDVRTTLASDSSFADVAVTVETSAPCGYTWTLRDPHGEVVLTSTETATATAATARLERPQLWWTHDHGTPALYSLDVVLDAPGADTHTQRVGFRRVRLVMHEGAWDEPAGLPKSRSHPPITIELNGRRLFAKGSNWVSVDLFPGRVTDADYAALLTLARDAHFNLLRCWGGAGAPRESFFRQCDELGLLVWQEFPLACNLYPDDAAYLADLDRESRALIRRVRQHACLALWCGGNELFNAWSGMDDQALPLRLLNRNCYELDPATPFLPTSPLDGMAHGDYRFRDEHGRDVFQIFQSHRATAYSEFGCPGPSPADYLREFIPADELWPARPGTSWETHHAFNVWSSDPNYWINARAIEHYFGASATLEEFTARGAWLQSEGYKSIFEEARRQAPRCAIALNWCFNEPWPTAANNSLINFPARPKPAYFAVQAACRPILASARIPKFQWRTGELFSAELWLLNDSPAAAPSGEMVAVLECDGAEQELLRWTLPVGAQGKNLAGPIVRVALPVAARSGEFTLRLAITGQPTLASSYRLSLRDGENRIAAGSRALNT